MLIASAMFVFDVPAAGLITLGVLILGIAQLTAGTIGLFLGAVVLAIWYELFIA
ncbi:protein of unknown function [Shewanella benthica]|uniref:Uncharacterized protein n=1 Tax=Shewanella benthica TaxID=43661 RepID=A0A330M6U8_9GAMM|nr:hypothetical protein [Shewanella benthica]SQH78226.1 protein of unknown function [Shewanella benthica]